MNHKWIRGFKATVELLEPHAPITEDDVLLLGALQGKGGLLALDKLRGYRVMLRESDETRPCTQPLFIITPSIT